MSTTFGELKTRLGVVLQDPNQRTFTDALVAELILDGLVEVGRISPEQFTEDLTPVDYQLTYALRSADFGGVAVPEIEVTRVEVWDANQQPEAFVATVARADRQPVALGDMGWYLWNGELTLPTRTVSGLVGQTNYVIRVWGYSPFVKPTDDADVIAVSDEQEQAIVWYVRVAALELLLASRDLFTQWQTRSGNTDISPAQLMNQKSIAEQMWQRKSRQIARHRSEY